MMVASQRARRPAVRKQNHPRRNKSKDGAAATLRSRPRGALDHAVRVVHGVCCLAGSASLIDDLRAELRSEGVPAAIRRHDTATLFDWLLAAVSYQGISDRVAFNYMERHGRARWRDIETKLGQLWGHKRTRAPQQPAVSFDYFVGTRSVAVAVRSSSISRLWHWRLRQRSAASSPWARAATPRKKQGMN